MMEVYFCWILKNLFYVSYELGCIEVKYNEFYWSYVALGLIGKVFLCWNLLHYLLTMDENIYENSLYLWRF